MKFDDKFVIDIINGYLPKFGTPQINIEYTISCPDDRFKAEFWIRIGNTYYGIDRRVKSPSNYYQRVLLDSLEPGPRGELWKVYDAFLKSAGVFREEKPAFRRFSHGMHINKKHSYFQSYCAEFCIGHMEQAFLLNINPDLKRYRDHLAHVFRVGSLGQFLISNFLLKNSEFKEYLNLNNLNSLDISWIWWISSLIHDIGYLYEIMFQLFEKKIDFSKTIARYVVFDEFVYFLKTGKYPNEDYEFDKEYINNAIIEDFKKLVKNISKYKKFEGRGWCYHETIGAFLLYIHQYDYGIPIKEDDVLKKELILNEILNTVSKHHGIKKIDFNDDPFGFLLIFCDECQEWGRPAKTVDHKWSCELDHINVNLDNNSINVCIDYPSNDILKDTQFDKHRFLKDKEGALKRLSAPFNFDIVSSFPGDN